VAHSFVGGYPQVYAQLWKTPEKSVDKLRRVAHTANVRFLPILLTGVS